MNVDNKNNKWCVCVCVCVCRGCASTGLSVHCWWTGYSCTILMLLSANKTYRVVGVKNRQFTIWFCRSSIPLGGRVRLDFSSGRSFRRSWSSLGRFREGRPQRYLSVGAPPSVPRPWRYPEGRRYWWVGRSVNSLGRARSPVFDKTRSWTGPRPWQDPEGRGYWCVGWSVCLSGEKVRFTLPW